MIKYNGCTEVISANGRKVSDLYNDRKSPVFVSCIEDVAVVGPGAVKTEIVKDIFFFNGKYEGYIPMDANSVFFAQNLNGGTGSITIMEQPRVPTMQQSLEGGAHNLDGIMDYFSFLRSNGIDLRKIKTMEMDIIYDEALDQEIFDTLIDHETWEWLSGSIMGGYKNTYQKLGLTYAKLLRPNGKAIIYFHQNYSNENKVMLMITLMQEIFNNVTVVTDVFDAYEISDNGLAAECIPQNKKIKSRSNIIGPFYQDNCLIVAQK